MPVLEPWSWFTPFKANLKPTNLNQKAFSCITKDRALHFMKSPELLICLKITLISLQKTPEGNTRWWSKEGACSS